MSKVGIIEFDKLELGDILMRNNTYLREWRCPLPSLTHGECMFQFCYELTAFTSDLSSLMFGRGMFQNCYNLTSFNIDLSSLVNGSGMFGKCTNLTSFSSDLSSMTNGNSMFKGCTNLTSFKSDLSSLTYGGDMFYECTALTTFSSDLSRLMYGECMFQFCTSLTSFSSDLPSLQQGASMFMDCKIDAPSVKNIALTINKKLTNNPRIDIGVDKNIVNDEQVKKDIGLIKYKGWNVYTNGSNATTYTLPKYAGYTTLAEIKAKDADYLTTDIDGNGVWTEHLPDLTQGRLTPVDIGMFANCTNLTSFNADLSSLTDGDSMFYYCTALNSFTSDLRRLTDGDWMFHYCSALTTFNSDLSSLTNGGNMFENTKLNSFSSDLPNLTNGRYMFWNCSTLTSFSSDLPSLTNGEYMFDGCKLDTASVQHIADTINDLKSKGLTVASIHIGYASDVLPSVLWECNKKLTDKGWNAYFNGSKI